MTVRTIITCICICIYILSTWPQLQERESSQSGEAIQWQVGVSYVEIYKEELRDLLDGGIGSQHLVIRDNEQGHTSGWALPIIDPFVLSHPCLTIPLIPGIPPTHPLPPLSCGGLQGGEGGVGRGGAQSSVCWQHVQSHGGH